MTGWPALTPMGDPPLDHPGFYDEEPVVLDDEPSEDDVAAAEAVDDGPRFMARRLDAVLGLPREAGRVEGGGMFGMALGFWRDDELQDFEIEERCL